MLPIVINIFIPSINYQNTNTFYFSNTRFILSLSEQVHFLLEVLKNCKKANLELLSCMHHDAFESVSSWIANLHLHLKLLHQKWQNQLQLEQKQLQMRGMKTKCSNFQLLEQILCQLEENLNRKEAHPILIYSEFYILKIMFGKNHVF